MPATVRPADRLQQVNRANLCRPLERVCVPTGGHKRGSSPTPGQICERAERQSPHGQPGISRQEAEPSVTCGPAGELITPRGAHCVKSGAPRTPVIEGPPELGTRTVRGLFVCQDAFRIFFEFSRGATECAARREDLALGLAREWLGRRAGFAGCEPAAQALEPFPVCPPGPPNGLCSLVVLAGVGHQTPPIGGPSWPVHGVKLFAFFRRGGTEWWWCHDGPAWDPPGG